MKVILEHVASYKKLIKDLTAIPSYKKLMNSVEQCIELEAVVEEDNDHVNLYMVESGSHALKLKYNYYITSQQPGSFLIMIDKLKNLTSKLKPNKVAPMIDSRNLMTYVQPPLGGIHDTLFCYEEGLNKDMLNTANYKLVIEDISFILDLVPIVAGLCFNDQSIVMYTSPTEIVMICQFCENGFIKFTMPSISRQVAELRLNVKPRLLKILSTLVEGIEVHQHFKDPNLYLFNSYQGSIAMKTDPDIPSIVRTIDAVMKLPSTAEFTINHGEVLDACDLQSYGSNNHISLWIEKGSGVLKYSTDRNNIPATTQIISQGAEAIALNTLTLRLDQFSNALKALGSGKGILTITNVLIQVKEVKLGQHIIRGVILKADDDPETKAEALIYEVPQQ